MEYKHKYSKYKTKYLALSKLQFGGKKLIPVKNNV